MMGLFMFVTLITTAQSRQGTVSGIVQLGSQDYAFIAEYGTTNIFKTSPYSAGELNESQMVLIQETETEDQVIVYAETITSPPLYALLETVENGQSAYFPDMTRMPFLSEDILFFDDRSHLQEAYDMVTLFLDDKNYLKDYDEKLDEIEQEYVGYTSFRTYFNQRFNWLEGAFQEQELETIYAKDFVNDEIHKFFQNNYLLIGIGDTVYMQFDQNTFIATHKDSVENITILRDIFIEKDLDGSLGLINIPEIRDHRKFTIHLDKGIYNIIDPFSKATVQGTNGIYYQSIIQPERPPCDQYSITIYYDIIYDGYGGDDILADQNQDITNAVMVVDWGDGIETINNYTGTPLTHTYAQIGYYEPQLHLTFLDNGDFVEINDGTNAINTGPFQQQVGGEDIIVDLNVVCTDNDRAEIDAKSENGWRMYNKAWIKDNILYHQIGGFTHSWKWVNGEWKRKRSNISIKVHGQFKNDNCNIMVTKEGFKHHDNDKKIQKTKTKWWRYHSMGGTGENWSIHNLHKNDGTNIWQTIYIDPCQ